MSAVVPNRCLTPEEELDYLYEITGHSHERALGMVLNAFDILQSRAQALLGLVTICLTVSGFSGPAIAASSPFARASIVFGITFVLLSAIITLCGPLQLRWSTQWRADTIDRSLVNLIRRRNARTRKYHAAFITLVIGLTGYVASLLAYLLQVQ
jgi:hypothetical protein